MGTALLMGSSVMLLPSNPSFEPDIVYVDDDNTTGIEDGSIFHPYNTISEGLAAVAVGGTVHVLGGTYVETLEIHKSVALLGESPVTTEVRSTTTWPGFRIAAANVTLSGFSFKETSLLLDRASNVRIAGNEFVRASLSVEDSQQLSVLHNQFYLYSIFIRGLHEGDISENAIVGASESIYVERGEDVQIESNTIWNETESMYRTGVRVFHSQNITILNNSIWNLFTGIQLGNDSNVVIQDNSVATTYSGIYAQGSNHITLRANVLKKDRYAMDLRMSTNLTVEGNSFSGNRYNLLVLMTKGAVIFHNNFNESIWGVRDDNTTFNSWHHPVLLEGNYWSNYDGLDDGSGTGKHAIAGDGIGDTLIPHPDPGYDYYPLMRPWRLSQPPVADAGPDQTVFEGEVVQFNGSGSRGSSSHTTLTFGRNVWVTEGTDFLAFPDIAVYGKDEIYVAYETFPMGAMDVYLSRSLDGGGSFEKGRIVHEKKEGAQGSPAVTVDDNGTVYVVWDQNRTPPLYEDNLFLAKSIDNGLNFTEGILVNQNTAVSGLALPSSIAVGRSGNIYAVWHGWIDPIKIEIYFSRSTDGGKTFDPEVRVNDDVAPWAKLCPDMAVGPNEEIYVVWMEQRKTNDWDIFLSKSSDNGVSFGQDVLVNENVTSRNETYPSISVDEKGRIFVVYGAYNETSDQIFLAFSGDGGLSFDEVQVTNESIRWRSFPQVATYSHILYLIWQEGDWPVGRSDIYFSFTSEGAGNLSLPVRVNDASTNLSHLDPSMDVDAVGNVHITWSDNRQGLLAAYYAKGNLTLGDLDIVSHEWDFDASIDSDGDGNHTNDVDGTEPTPTHIYGDDGIYTVTLTVKDEYGANDSDTMNVTVGNLPPGTTDPVIFGYGDEGSPVWGLTGDAIDPGSDDLIFEWDYGDGTSETKVYYNNGASPEPTYDPTTNEIKSPWGVFPFSVSDRSDHVYGDNGVYPVSLTISDDDGGVVVFSTTDSTIENVPPILSANVPSIVDEGDAVLFSANAVDNGTDDLTFIWDWGDGTPTSITTYYNNAPVNTPDSYPSPWGTYPFSSSDSVSHIYGDDGSYLLTLTVEDDDGGSTSYQKTITVLNVNPTVNINGPYSGDENKEIHFSADATDPGSDDLTFEWEFEYGPTITSVYYNDGMNPDPPQSPWGIFPFSTADSVSNPWGDNGNFTVTLTVTDDDGGFAVRQTAAIVSNVVPTIEGGIEYYLNASFSFRIAGEKWHNVEIHLYEDGNEIGYANITRYPGSPNDQMVTLADISIDFSKTYSAVAYYTPEDDPINGQIWGATPAWVILEYEDGEERIHHTFNVRHEDTWTWVIDDFSPYFLGHNITFVATASDPGSDDLTFTWDWGDGNTTENVYYNDGIGPDPHPSPEVNPISVADTVRHGYALAGMYTVTLTVTDDDGGETTILTVLSI